MGALLSAMKQGREPLAIFLDFENSEPGEAEKELYEICNEVLQRGPDILKKLLNYQGCEEYIRKAITTPTPENEEAAWHAVLPAVDQLQEFFDFATELENIFPMLLVALCDQDPKHTIQNKQALAKQLADVLDFVLRFDDAKMVNPAIQNDFSYYRRTLNRMKINKKDGNVKVRDELANRMSLFFAYPTPMMKVLSDATSKSLSSDTDVSRDNVTQGLAVMANVCYEMVQNKRFDNDETNLFCLRAMTGSIILYDHIHQLGAFVKKSPINMKGCVLQLKGYRTSDGKSSTDGLLNALRFTTLHLNDPETPGSVKALLNG
mmetsp:Transcript_26910/g.65425  ORF Transcript_26910/g.65425 Transcript_26910/m.65425 type:complete len:319 (+) Transcript_26910:135-1091(+)